MQSQHGLHTVVRLRLNIVFQQKSHYCIITSIIHSVYSRIIKRLTHHDFSFFQCFISPLYSIGYKCLSAFIIQYFFHNTIPSFITFT